MEQQSPRQPASSGLPDRPETNDVTSTSRENIHHLEMKSKIPVAVVDIDNNDQEKDVQNETTGSCDGTDVFTVNPSDTLGHVDETEEPAVHFDAASESYRDPKQRQRRTWNVPTNKILRSRTSSTPQKQSNNHDDAVQSSIRVPKSEHTILVLPPRTTHTRAAASKKDATEPNPSMKKNDSSHLRRHPSKRSSRINKMLPKKLSSSSSRSIQEMDLPKSDAAVTPVFSNSISSHRNIPDDIDQYRITNPLIADYNEVQQRLYSQPTTSSTLSSSKTLSLAQIRHITDGISFAIPDTYSIRYMAQLLGLHHIFQDLTNGTTKNSNTSNIGKVSIEPLQSMLFERSHPNETEKHRAAAAMMSRNDTDTIYNVPTILTPFVSNPRINFWTTNTREEFDLLCEASAVLQEQEQRRTTRHASSPNLSPPWTKHSSQQSLLLDPFYVHLWQCSVRSSIGTSRHGKVLQRIPITAIQHAKMFHSTSSTSSSSVAVAQTTNTTTTTSSTTSTTRKLQDNTNKNVDGTTVEEATLTEDPNQNENSIEEPSSDLDVITDKGLHVAQSVASSAVPLASSPPRMDSVVKESFVISSHQQDVLRYVLNTANASTANQRYIFIPLEQAIEKYPQDTRKYMTAMDVESPHTSCGIQTGWVAIDAESQITTEENDEKRIIHTSSSVKVVGLVLYQLEWCAFAESIDTSVELIVHVLGTHVGDAPTLDTLDFTATDNTKSGTYLIEGRRLFGTVNPTLIDNEDVTWLRLVLLSLVLEHTRRFSVWYAIVNIKTDAPESDEDRMLYEMYFNMVPARKDGHLMICDLHNTTVRYTFLQYQEKLQSRSNALLQASFQTKDSIDSHRVQIESLSLGKQRWLVRLPTADVVEPCFSPRTSSEAVAKGSSNETPQNESVLQIAASQTSKYSKTGFVFSNPSNHKKGVQVALSVVLGENGSDDMTIYKLNVGESTLGPKVTTPSYSKEPPSLHIMRNFPLPPTSCMLQASAIEVNNEPAAIEVNNEPEVYPILYELMSKQKDLKDMESDLEPTLYKLLFEVVSDRLAYENPDRISKQNEEIRILKESEQLRERRIEQDLALQKQLEQDMDAVCEICLDGEVTPDNQILFCESCNVAVHQMCYGIDKVPEGDYYCIPCRRLGHDKEQLKDERQNDSALLPMCCELCPIRQGAFVRTDIPPKGTDTQDKFVHVLCAKWQGLNHIGNNKELVEDVTNIRREFRRHHVKCDLCLGERGGMNKCMANNSCKKWFHVTCARAVGTMRVIHGENCHGDVEEKAWNLFCPEHSGIATGDIPDNAVLVETLIQKAKEFPPEETPPPPNSQFNTLTGPERRLLLSDPLYEQALITELLRNKFYGVRCEICDLFDDESKTWTRCVSCNVIFCRFCKLDVDEVKGFYKCTSCKYVDQKRKAKEPYEDPTCCTCVQVGGLLRESYANPVSSKFKRKPQYKGSLYAKQTWVHSLCAFWLPDIELPRDVATVDLSGVVCVTNRGTSMIHHKRRCYVCGQRKGLKMYCDKNDCSCNIDGQREKLVVHVTCARQAGLEVRVDDERMNNKGGPLPYVRCYRHGGNEFNLRAKLEDLLELEKKRAGKEYLKTDAPMKLSEASRLLYSAIQVMRIFGWAWRWAEWWVDFNSSWEPLLEPGQREKDMTKEELKIVDSTRDSRCEDARRCRLAAFGAALRNRLYDTNDGFKRTPFDKALRAVLNTPSLVGPLSPLEIDFYIDWLGRAYRSKSRLLYMGKFKNSISSEAPFCIHEDGTPKFELGNRSLPGEQDLPNYVIFETDHADIDSFLRDEVLIDDKTSSKSSQKPMSKKGNTKLSGKSPAVSKKASQITPSKRPNRDRRRSPTVDDLYVPSSEGKRQRSVPDRLIAVQEQLPTNTKKRGRPPRSPYLEGISDSLVHVAGIYMDGAIDVSTNLPFQPDVLRRNMDTRLEEVNAVGIVDTITASESLSNQHNDKDVCEKTPEEHSNLAPTEKKCTSIVWEVADNLLDTKPNVSDCLTVEETPSRLLRKSLAQEVPSADAYTSVKKRKREATRMFTYEHHEMKGSIRKRPAPTNEAPDTGISHKKRRPRQSKTATEVEMSENNMVVSDCEAKESAIPEQSVSMDTSNAVPVTSTELTTDAAAIKTETATAFVNAQDTNVKHESDVAMTAAPTALTSIPNNDSSDGQALSTADVPRTTYTKIRRPGRPRSKNKPHR